MTKIRRALGDGTLASSFNLLLPDAVASGNVTVVPNAVVREISVDKKTGLVEGHTSWTGNRNGNCTPKARVVVVGASCLESTRILLNSKIANSSGTLGHYLHDQFYMSNSVVALIPEARNGKAPRGLVGGAGYIPRFRNIGPKRRTLSVDMLSTSQQAGLPMHATFRHGERSCRSLSMTPGVPDLRRR